MTDIPVETLRELLDYDPFTGLFTWKWRSTKWFKHGEGRYTAERNAKIWNSRYAGTEALTATDERGRKSGRILDQNVIAHRVAFAIHHGYYPPKQTDHMDGDPGNNRWHNLKAATPTENGRNTILHKNNTSGHVGVYWYKPNQKWTATLRVGKQRLYLGLFDDIADAVTARKIAEVQYGFSARHGSKRT